MDTGTGEIRRIPFGEKPTYKEVEISEQLAEILKQYKPEERMIVFHGLQSKNKSAKRRALRKIEKASRRRNRR